MVSKLPPAIPNKSERRKSQSHKIKSKPQDSIINRTPECFALNRYQIRQVSSAESEKTNAMLEIFTRPDDSHHAGQASYRSMRRAGSMNRYQLHASLFQFQQLAC